MDRKKGTVDHTLLILVVILLLFGLTVLLSTSAYNGQVKFSDPASYFKKQLFATVLGIAVLYLAAELDYHRLEKWGVAAYLLSLSGVLRSVWFAFPIAEVASLILSLFFLRTTLKKTGMAMPKTK